MFRILICILVHPVHIYSMYIQDDLRAYTNAYESGVLDRYEGKYALLHPQPIQITENFEIKESILLNPFLNPGSRESKYAKSSRLSSSCYLSLFSDNLDELHQKKKICSLFGGFIIHIGTPESRSSLCAIYSRCERTRDDMWSSIQVRHCS